MQERLQTIYSFTLSFFTTFCYMAQALRKLGSVIEPNRSMGAASRVLPDVGPTFFPTERTLLSKRPQHYDSDLLRDKIAPLDITDARLGQKLLETSGLRLADNFFGSRRPRVSSETETSGTPTTSGGGRRGGGLFRALGGTPFNDADANFRLARAQEPEPEPLMTEFHESRVSKEFQKLNDRISSLQATLSQTPASEIQEMNTVRDSDKAIRRMLRDFKREIEVALRKDQGEFGDIVSEQLRIAEQERHQAIESAKFGFTELLEQAVLPLSRDLKSVVGLLVSDSSTSVQALGSLIQKVEQQNQESVGLVHGVLRKLQQVLQQHQQDRLKLIEMSEANDMLTRQIGYYEQFKLGYTQDVAKIEAIQTSLESIKQQFEQSTSAQALLLNTSVESNNSKLLEFMQLNQKAAVEKQQEMLLLQSAALNALEVVVRDNMSVANYTQVTNIVQQANIQYNNTASATVNIMRPLALTNGNAGEMTQQIVVAGLIAANDAIPTPMALPAPPPREELEYREPLMIEGGDVEMSEIRKSKRVRLEGDDISDLLALAEGREEQLSQQQLEFITKARNATANRTNRVLSVSDRDIYQGLLRKLSLRRRDV